MRTYTVYKGASGLTWRVMMERGGPATRMPVILRAYKHRWAAVARGLWFRATGQ